MMRHLPKALFVVALAVDVAALSPATGASPREDFAAFAHGNYVQAARSLAPMARRGNPFGQCMLGLMYDKGHGVERDVVEAYKWLNLAAAAAPAREREPYLRIRDAVASKMSPNQIVEGQRLAVDWRRS